MAEDLSPFVVASLTYCRTPSSLRASTKSTLSRTQEGQAPLDIPWNPKRSALSSLHRKAQSLQDGAMQTRHSVGANAPNSEPTAQGQ